MKRVFGHLTAISLLTLALASAPPLGGADSKATTQATGQSKGNAPQGKPKRNWYPCGGIVASVNKEAGTLSLKKKQGQRVLKLDSRSTLEVNGKPVGLGSVKAGDYTHGKLQKDSAGHEVILNAKFEPEPPNKRTEKQDPRKTPEAKMEQ
jgi:hypothetical protein